PVCDRERRLTRAIGPDLAPDDTSFLVHRDDPHRHLHSFPTRRSSDLTKAVVFAGPCRVRILFHPRQTEIDDERRQWRRVGIKHGCGSGKLRNRVHHQTWWQERPGRAGRQVAVSCRPRLVFTSPALDSNRWLTEEALARNG